MAPHKASATKVAASGRAPSRPNTASPALSGTISATVIQSSPSMKLTTFTSQTPPTRMTPRSSHHGSPGETRISAGRVEITVATAAICRIRRGIASIGLRSSTIPTTARPTVAAAIIESRGKSSLCRGRKMITAEATRSVAAITATPAPCGVGIVWDDRIFGFTSA